MDSVLSIKYLRALDKFGWIPGPEESDEAFKLRLKGFRFNSPQSINLQSRAAELVWNLFKTRPRGYRWRFETSSLFSWQLGYFQCGEADEADSIVIKMQKGESIWGYCFEEVLAHELTHAARSAFPADLFDEFLCYKTSHKWYRRFFGPFFSSCWAERITVVFMISSWLRMLLVWLSVNILFEQLVWRLTLVVFNILLLMLLWYLVKLSLFLRAESKLVKAFGEMGLWWLFRLTQKEALFVAWRGIESLKKFEKSGCTYPRDRLFVDQLGPSAPFTTKKESK